MRMKNCRCNPRVLPTPHIKMGEKKPQKDSNPNHNHFKTLFFTFTEYAHYSLIKVLFFVAAKHHLETTFPRKNKIAHNKPLFF